MRIALFSDTFPPQINGVANSTHILYQEMKNHGHDVFVVTAGVTSGGAEWSDDHRVLTLPGMELKFLYGYTAASPIQKKAMQELKKLHLDLIHVQTEFGIGIFARFCAKELNIPIVSTYHTTYEDYTHYANPIHSKLVEKLERKAVGHISRWYADSTCEVIAPSEKTKELLESYNVHRTINVIPTGLMLQKFDPAKEDPAATKAIRSEFSVPEDAKLIVYVGRLAEEKALDLVMRGVAEAIKAGDDIRFLIVGGGPDLERLQKMAKDLGVSDRVKLAGPRPADKVPDIYRAADAFISASLSETQGMTFIEALAAGIPLFARKDEVLEELLIPEKTGWFFTDEHDLAKKLHDFLQLGEERLEEIGKDCLEQVKPWSSEVFYNAVIRVYERAVKDFQNAYTIRKIKRGASVSAIHASRYGENEEVFTVSSARLEKSGLKKGSRLTESDLAKLQNTEA